MKLTKNIVRKNYDHAVDNNYLGDYEHNRWFKTKNLWQAYLFHYNAYNHHLNLEKKPKKIL